MRRLKLGTFLNTQVWIQQCGFTACVLCSVRADIRRGISHYNPYFRDGIHLSVAGARDRDVKRGICYVAGVQ